MKITTTLNRIKSNSPCQEGWTKLLTFLNKTKADDEELDLLTILESNGVQDCLWAFQCTDNHDSIYKHIAADFAESVLYIFEKEYPNDNRPRLSIQAARDYADGKINKEELDAARSAASAAAWDAALHTIGSAAWAAWYAARSAAMDAAMDAANAAARSAVMDAAMDADMDAAWDAAMDASMDAELEKQKEILIKYLS
jgi:hypothetical protein